ncbi:unnamed protein product [Mesocestoides corti]|uniref:Uncharacterized protein n=1 Tax=Mesocestoides corti TaxID=53468 RepID=A0A0R3UJX7_MESCO|nr:unnamed protein product [Mesocestoides corti]
MTGSPSSRSLNESCPTPLTSVTTLCRTPSDEFSVGVKMNVQSLRVSFEAAGNDFLACATASEGNAVTNAVGLQKLIAAMGGELRRFRLWCRHTFILAISRKHPTKASSPPSSTPPHHFDLHGLAASLNLGSSQRGLSKACFKVVPKAT